MVQEAEQNAEADKQKRELVEAKNQAESLVHTTETALKDHGEGLEAADKEAIETALQELKDVKDGEDLEAIKSKTEALSQASMKLGEAMYKAQQAEEGGADAAEGADAGSQDDGVVDADFEEVDDDKKDK
jgi:molecular chaperone DnaK